MEDRDWLIIKVLYEHKNITRAAQALFISQPALTARIRNIEEEFGVKMIYRGSRGIQFTSEGDYLAQCAHDILTHIRQVREQVVDIGSGVKGTLRLAAPNYLAKFKLPRLLGMFKEQYPQVEFDVINAWSRDIYSLLYNQDIQVGFVRTNQGWRGETHVLHEEPVCIASTKPIVFAELPNLPRIDYHTDIFYKALLDSWWNENFSQPPKIGMTVSQLDICTAMIANGLGYGFVPIILVNDASHIHKIPITDKEGNPIIRKTSMLYQKEVMGLKIVKLFIDFAKTVDFNKLT